MASSPSMLEEGQSFLCSNPTPLLHRGRSVGIFLDPQTVIILFIESRKNPFSLLVAISGEGSAYGYLYLDDGDSLGTVETKDYSLLQFSVMEVTKWWCVVV